MTQINTIQENAVVQTGQRPGAASEDGFQNSLDIALAHKAAGKADGEQSAALSEPRSPHNNQAIAPSEAEVVCQTDSLLGLLESYADDLGNPMATMKDLAALVGRIKDRAQQLMDSADRSTSAGNGLKDIAKQAAIAANVEYIKFQRGDFI